MAILNAMRSLQGVEQAGARKPEDHHIYHGAKINASQLSSIITRLVNWSFETEKQGGKRGTPLCVWSRQGIGKTETIKETARENKWELAYCAPAQFEEMGDFHGMPLTRQPKGKRAFTDFAAPKWVPKKKGPGVLLVDDLNRAEIRLLQGLMQLFQNYELFSWRLPPLWHIVATCNPEGGDYTVTPMDDAMLGRFLHFTLVFDCKSWVDWARKAGVDPRGIAFVSSYPEIAQEGSTTPRSLVQFFEQIKNIQDLKTERELVRVLAGSLDRATQEAFFSFVHKDMHECVSIEEILDTEDFGATARKIGQWCGENGKRLDRLNIIITRLLTVVSDPGFVFNDLRAGNLAAFLKLDLIPNDFRLMLHKNLKKTRPELRSVLEDKELARLILEG